jgi:hypothetical protein
MPTKKKTTAKPKKTEQKIISKRKTYISIIVIAVALLLLGGAWWVFGGGKTMGIQKDMESYLEEKYGEGFVVGVPKLEGSGLGSKPDSHRAEAYPTSREDRTFEVGKRYRDGSFFDNYTSVVWKEEEMSHVNEFLKSIYPSTLPKVNLSIGTNTGQEPGPVSGAVPAIDTAIRKYNDKFYYQLGLKIHLNSLDDRAKSGIRDQFIKTYEFVKKRGVENATFGIITTVENENVSYSCSTNDISETVSLENMLDNCMKYPYKKGVN